MTTRQTYPTGVPCWVDLIQSDADATMAFYGELFGWTFEQRTPPGAPQRYCYARLDNLLVGAVGGPPVDEAETHGWTSYVCVDAADAAADRAVAAGGRVLVAPVDVGPPSGPTGRSALLADPAGAVIGVWQPIVLQGAELVNLPGSWNFSDLHIAGVDEVKPFYAAVFGWELDLLDMGGVESGMWRRPGYGDFLAADDPELRERQKEAPAGFADSVALVGFAPTGSTAGAGARWGTVFAVADVDDGLRRAVALGAAALGDIAETRYTRAVTVRDPQGAEIVLSQYLAPD